MSEHFHDNALVCANGHVAAVAIGLETPSIRNFCDICGAELFSRCPHCTHEIRGASVGLSLDAESVEADAEHYRTPNFCYRCGKPFPWTNEALSAARMLVKSLDIDRGEKAALVEAVDELVSESPRTELAVLKLKRFLATQDADVAAAFVSIISVVVSDAVREKLM